MELKITKKPQYKIFKIKAQKYEIWLLNIGASIWKLKTKDKFNKLADIGLYHPRPEDYFENDGYYGSCVGRNAGRISGGKFMLNNKKYVLPQNEGQNNLHSSGLGISERIMNDEISENNDYLQIDFTINLKSSDDYFPGDINIRISYLFQNDHFAITFKASASEDTICNLTNHIYLNLSGDMQKSINNLEVKNTFKSIWKLNKNAIPTKKIAINEVLKKEWFNVLDCQNISFFKSEKGIDHALELDDSKTILVRNRKSGRKVKITTTYPYAVLYSQNHSTKSHGPYHGLAIEPQFLTNDININKNSPTILKKGNEYHEKISYYFQ